ncbi:MAG: sigma-54-dependent Fis family transcriptional regulator, partial [Muribaculaceae bacterium]|nr:sigma-54-dependent Fis family transcriptional regulator [Muribaculaceae bacterium]
IALLARHFAAEAARRHGMAEPRLMPDAAAYLASLPWPGNIRQLKNMVERTIIMAGKENLDADDFMRSTSDTAASSSMPSGTLDAMERARIADTLAACRGNISRAAAQLGLSRAALYRRMEKYDIRP